HRAMEIIAAEGTGVVLYLKREQGSEMLAPRGDTGSEGSESGDASKPSTMATVRLKAFREYGIGAQILRDLGVGKIRLISNYSRRLVSLPGYGLEITDLVPLGVPAEAVPAGASREPGMPEGGLGGDAAGARREDEPGTGDGEPTT